MSDLDDSLGDPARLAALQSSCLMDSPREEAFDRLTRLASRITGAPTSLLSLLDNYRQFFKSFVGLQPSLANPRETPLSMSFCKYVVEFGEPLIVADARNHPLLKDNHLIDHGVVAYAGFPLITKEGLVLGSFSAIDSRPREWTTEQIDNLRDLAASAITEIELRRANESKDRFFAMLSHELRTPLSPALLTATELLNDVRFPEEFRDDIRLIHRNIQFQRTMIDSLLDVTRISNGKLELNIESIDAHALIRNSLQTCLADASQKSMQIELELGAERCSLTADAGKLQQVVCNLLKNAIKFSHTNSQVVVRTSNDKHGAFRMDVIDSGVGISSESLPFIFDPFQQGGRGVTQRFGGLGLGLAICRGIIDAHGGSISAFSAGPGKGSTMTVVLPSATKVLSLANETPVAGSPRRRDLAILLVEDHEDTLRVLSRLLRRLDHRVTTATGVNTALDAAAKERFDLLISDVGLPDGTGLQLLQQLREKYPLNAIAMTGYGMESDIQQSKEAGFQKHLTKPINMGELENAIDTMASWG